MFRLIFDNLILIVACAVSFLVGVMVSSQTLKDKINGVSADLRAALKEREAAAVASVKSAHAQATTQAVKQIQVSPTLPSAPPPIPPVAPAQ